MHFYLLVASNTCIFLNVLDLGVDFNPLSSQDCDHHFLRSAGMQTDPELDEVFDEGNWPFGFEGEPNSVPIPSGEACQAMSYALVRAEDLAGEFSFGGEATTLPAMPGLHVEGVGHVLLPLNEDSAQKLIAVCQKSSFGRRLDTLMDESVRKSWQLAPDQVTLKNPRWQPGIDELCPVITEKLGYKGVPLECKLYKLLVYGPGGHFIKHQDTEKENGMVATLVVQLPSEHEGGDVVVYRGKDVQYRHNFGKTSGLAPYLTHYAVHYTDAEHVVEQVTSGYRLVLVYSICLPSTMQKVRPLRPLNEELGDAISSLEPGETFALLLEHEYTEKSIGDFGVQALKGVDRARYNALAQASAVVAANSSKLQIWLGQLQLDIDFCDEYGYWDERGRYESMYWYTTTGGACNPGISPDCLDFLNPSQQTLNELWSISCNSIFEGYRGNDGPTRSTTYSRFAIVGRRAPQRPMKRPRE